MTPTAWLKGSLAGLFALVMLAAPAEQARAVLARASFALAYAMPDGSLPDICGDHGGPADHDRHAGQPACLACILMAAPGLPAPASALPARTHAPAAALLAAAAPSAATGPACLPCRARAPPTGRIA